MELPYVALLRGINVGGKNKISMQSLASIFVGVGCRDVRTYIQSGNVLFAADLALVDQLPARVSAEIRRTGGLQVPVIVRSGLEFQRIASSNPFVESGMATDRLHVAFLATVPDTVTIGELDPRRSPPDEYAVRGGEIYLYCPGGLARTKYTNEYFDRTLRTTSTIRNWNTVLKLRGMIVGPLPGA